MHERHATVPFMGPYLHWLQFAGQSLHERELSLNQWPAEHVLLRPHACPLLTRLNGY